MDGSALRGDDAIRREPGWGDVRQAVMMAAEACAASLACIRLRGGGLGAAPGGPALALAEEAVAALQVLAGRLRPLAFDEAVIEEERARAADEALAAAGLAPPQPRRHLRAVP